MAKGRRIARGQYRYTAKRAAALKRAQAISARKRRGKRIKVAAGVAAGIVGVGAAAYLGHRHGGAAVDSVKNWKPQLANTRNRMAARIAVSPGNKEVTRVKNAISPATTPRPNAPRARASRAATQGAANYTRTDLDKTDPVDPNSIDPTRNNAFPNRAEHEKRNNSYNVDKFIPRDILKGRKISTNVAKGAIKKHAENKGSINKNHVDQSAILNQMIADGTVRKRTKGRKTNSHKSTPGPGSSTPKAAQGSPGPHGGLTESQWNAALAFDAPPQTPVTRARSGPSTGSKTSSSVTPNLGSGSRKRIPTSQVTAARLSRVSEKLGMAPHDSVSNWDILDATNKELTRKLYGKHGLVITSRGRIGAPSHINYFEGDE